ncbi:MAG: hypothetical protein HRF42_07155 [Candidatus Brocadia sp.]
MGTQAFTHFRRILLRKCLDKETSLSLCRPGGGKSLCYQLPALLFDGITIVISPLIALMKGQVDGLLANGIPATFINSSLIYDEIDVRRRSLSNNEVKILYIAPERLVMPEFLQFLQELKVSLFAIDE